MSAQLSRELNEKFGRYNEFHRAIDCHWPAIDTALRAMSTLQQYRDGLLKKQDQLREMIAHTSEKEMTWALLQGELAGLRVAINDIDCLLGPSMERKAA